LSIQDPDEIKRKRILSPIKKKANVKISPEGIADNVISVSNGLDWLCVRARACVCVNVCVRALARARCTGMCQPVKEQE
jgi:hypothetical protein